MRDGHRLMCQYRPGIKPTTHQGESHVGPDPNAVADQVAMSSRGASNLQLRQVWKDEAQRTSYGGDKLMRSRDASSNRSPSERSAPRNSTNSS